MCVCVCACVSSARGNPGRSVGTQVERSYTHRYARGRRTGGARNFTITSPPQGQPRVAGGYVRVARTIPDAPLTIAAACALPDGRCAPIHTHAHTQPAVCVYASPHRARYSIPPSVLLFPRRRVTRLRTVCSLDATSPRSTAAAVAAVASHSFSLTLFHCLYLSLALSLFLSRARDTWRASPTTVCVCVYSSAQYSTHNICRPTETDRYRAYIAFVIVRAYE